MTDAPHRKPVIGLMGGIGSGKSTVARCFAKLGCGVIDADALARHAINEPAVVAQLRAWWGDHVVDANGKVDRAAVSRIVFNAPRERERLEGLVHPRVHAGRAAERARMMRDAGIVAIVEDCPLLLETRLDAECDALVFVDASRDVRLERVRAGRGWSAEELDRREKSQLGLDIKRNRADYVISNEDDEAACQTHVRRVLPQILKAFV
jgi:dephospho-CoA kinase